MYLPTIMMYLLPTSSLQKLIMIVIKLELILRHMLLTDVFPLIARPIKSTNNETKGIKNREKFQIYR